MPKRLALPAHPPLTLYWTFPILVPQFPPSSNRISFATIDIFPGNDIARGVKVGAPDFVSSFFKTLALAAVSLTAPVGAQSALAQGNPYSGYTNTTSYFLDYVNGTSFSPGNTSDVQVDVQIAGVTRTFNVDTGSRGLYASIDELGPDFVVGPGSYAGQVDLDSSGRLSTGYWVPTTVGFDVRVGSSTSSTRTTVNSSANILAVTTLSAQLGRTAKFGVNTNVAGYNGTVNLDGGGTVAVQTDSSGSFVELTNNGTINQQISYSNNIKGLINNVSNFGIGFDLSGASGGTGPVGNNQNQIYNVLLNVNGMQAGGSMVAGYIIKTNGIQLGLTSSDTGYAYTTLNPTGFTSTNSVPDWQTPMGQTTVHGETHLPGSVVMDSGIPNAFISDPSLTVGDVIDTPIVVSLMNSGGLVGYKIDLDDASNELNPTSVLVVHAGTNSIYSQGQPPYQGQFFNTGRNVFEAFDMLYDARNGYMGVITNAYGASDSNVFFTAQEGGFPNPIPEARTTAMLLLGLTLLLVPLAFVRTLKKSRRAKA